MKKYNVFRIMLLAIPILLMLSFSSAFAEDHRKGQHEEESWMEEVGETLGWGTVFAASAAGILLPARRMVVPVKEHFPAGQQSLVSLAKGLTKYHTLLGITAVGISLIHGLSMYFAEEELSLGDWLGAVSASLMIIAAVIGGAMAIKKKEMKRLKKPHMVFLLAAGFFALVHVLTS